MPESQLFLIDGHALCYRSFYAIKGLTTSKGQATNAIYGFVNTLRKILRDYEPAYMAVCFDVAAKTRREEKYAEYKIQRPVMPDDLISQIPEIKKIVKTYNLPICERAGYEADDMIATIVSKFGNRDIEIVVVSDDKDMFQLVNENVRIFSARKDQLLNYRDIKRLIGIEPQYVPDLIGLAGDSTDNIPGVKGIGGVTARKLINAYGSIEDIYKHLDDIKPPRLRTILEEHRQDAIFSKGLALLESDAPLDLTLKDMTVGEADNKQLFEIFTGFEFRKFAEELAGHVQKKAELSVQHLKTAPDVEKAVSGLTQGSRFTFLLEVQSDEDAPLLANELYFMIKDSQVVFAVPRDLWPKLQGVFENTEVLKVTHNIKEISKRLSRQGIALPGEVFDTMLAGYLVSPAGGSDKIGTLAWNYLQSSISETDLLPRQVQAVQALYGPLSQDLKDKGLVDLLTKIEIPLSRVLARMEEEGVTFDEKLLKQLSVECEKKIAALTKDIFKMAGDEFNLNSPKQLSHILFEKLKLPVIKKTKTGASTDEGVLVRLAEQHELPASILEYRQYAKLKSTYLDALPKLINRETGRIHGVFNQVGTETGRLSSNNPNLQNIPVRTDLGRQIRKAVVPSQKGHWLIAADYSQIELRILAHLSQDETLMQAFKQGEDIHTYTAALIFDVTENQVTAAMRNSAKRVNFGIVYGMSAFGLAKDLNVPQGQAQEFIDKYFLRYPGVKTFMDNEIAHCEKRGYVMTLLNRRRYLPEIKSSNMAMRQFAQRQAINTPVQGSAADLIKLAMINIQKELDRRELATKMILTVHDELVFDAPEVECSDLIALVRDKMENAFRLSVPIKVSIKKGKNWLETEKVEE